jgi:serine/threonine protein kinase
MDVQVAPKQPGDPRRLGPYELLGRLGQGGMGVVFLGRERRTGRLAAVKALRPELTGDPAFAARFRREVEAARRVDSPHVAHVLDADPSADRPWLATEYVEGSTLATELATTGPLTGERLLEFATRIAQALIAIHAAGVVHRDLKPTNVLLQSPPGGGDGAGPGWVGVKVIDFGIAWAADATMTRSGLRFGTPSWMAPEQLRDRPAGPPADVFAWGALVAFAATGRHPFGGGPPDAVAYRILHDQPDLGGVPEFVRPLVQAALSRDPAARPTATRVAARLAAVSPPTLPLPAGDPTWVLPAAFAGSDGSAPLGNPTVTMERPTRRLRRRRVGRLLAAAALLVGLITAPHVVLAAVEGPPDPSAQHEYPSKQCPGDEEDRPTADDDDEHKPDKEMEDQDDKGDERDEEESEDAEELEEGKDRSHREPGATGQIGPGWPPAANQPSPSPQQPPSTHDLAGDPGSGLGNELLGS